MLRPVKRAIANAGQMPLQRAPTLRAGLLSGSVQIPIYVLYLCTYVPILGRWLTVWPLASMWWPWLVVGLWLWLWLWSGSGSGSLAYLQNHVRASGLVPGTQYFISPASCDTALHKQSYHSSSSSSSSPPPSFTSQR